MRRRGESGQCARRPKSFGRAKPRKEGATKGGLGKAQLMGLSAILGLPLCGAGVLIYAGAPAAIESRT
jgi:hypothetical protein